MKIKTVLMRKIAYAYIIAPIFVFALGFLRPQYGILISAAMAGVLYFVFRQKNTDVFEVDKRTVIIAFIVIPLLMLVCGQCGIFAQTPDWHGRNAMLQDLVNYKWPVYYSNGSAFTYYFGFFLIPALFGKVFGLGMAGFVQFLMTVVGMMLIYLYLIKLTKSNTFKKQVFVLIVLLFFGNFEDLRYIAEDVALGIIRYFNPSYAQPSYILCFTPNARSFALVFNQVIASFLILCVFFDEEKRVENLAVLGVGMILFSPFMLLSFVPVAMVALVKNVMENKSKISGSVKQIFSIQNIIMLVIMLPVLFMFYINNVAGEKPQELNFQFVSYGKNFYYYIIFILCEFLLYSIVLYGNYKRNPYFWVANITMIIMPLFKLGYWNDLNTRSTSVGLFILMIMCICFLYNKDRKIAKPRAKAVLCALLIGASLCPMNWYMNIIKSTAGKFAGHKMEECVANDYMTYEKIWERSSTPDNRYNYFTFNAEEKFFFKYIAKPNKNLK